MPRNSNRKSKSKLGSNNGSSFSTEMLESVLLKDDEQESVTTTITSVSKEECLMGLWAGYGRVNSFSVTLDNGGTILLIAKHVEPPNYGTGSGNISHYRKVKSYHVEANFYKDIAPLIHSKLNEQANHTIISCIVPIPYHIQEAEDSFHFLLSDLRSGFSDLHSSLTEKRTKTALKWLASFHALFWEDSTTTSRNQNNDFLWECGGYWHLQTRLEELEDIDTSDAWLSCLKKCAHVVDQRMKGHTVDGNGDSRGCPSYHTLCHGDFKRANLLFNEDGDKCSVVDFQYCGSGFGMKDVVMLLVSSVSSSVLGNGQKRGELKLLEYYHEILIQSLQAVNLLPNDRIEAITLQALTEQYELCLMDYVRFMAGWGFWGNNSEYATYRVKALLKEIAAEYHGKDDDNWKGAMGMSEEEWRSAIYHHYPLS